MEAERRLKSKMKKSDPTNFTIHDFLAECKSSDAAEERFDESAKTARGQRNYYVLGAPAHKLGNLYREVGNQLGAIKGWKEKKDDSGRFHLILGGPRGSGIPFKRFAQLFKWDYGITPHCNYFRGHVWLTQKVKLAQTLRQSGLEHLAPETFLFFPSSAEDNETEAFRIAAESNAKRASSNPTWIARASDASRGERTVISDDFDQIMSMLESQEKTSAAWSVQRYITNPLLLPGGRKFDLRFFALVDSGLNCYLCPQGVLKACAAPFSTADLSDKLAHLSCEAVQRQPGSAPGDFGIEQFSKWLSSERGTSYETAVMAPVREAVALVMKSAKTKLENVDHADFTSFQIFAFDFLLDADLKLWFLECSAPTEFPEDLVNDMAADVVDIAIKPVFAEERAEDRATVPMQNAGRLFQPLDETATSGSGTPLRSARRGSSSSNNNKK